MKYFLKAWLPMSLATLVFLLVGRVTHDVGCLDCARVCAWIDAGMVAWGALLIVYQPRGKHHARG